MIEEGVDGPNVDSLPPGVIPLAETILGGIPLPLDGPRDRREQLVRLLAAPHRLEPDWPEPAAPIEVNGGWLHAEVLADDRPLFEALLEQHRADGPEAVAMACQEARLPVSPYRSPDAVLSAETGCVGDRDRLGPSTGLNRTDLSGTRVIDLTTHWAGPLATKLLAAAGASVIKVDPECRPDGFRDRPKLYEELNGNKDVIDCDLRTDAGRTTFELLVADADLLVESFSRRVMPNLGYSRSDLRSRNRNLHTISIKPFGPATAEADWLAYGPGVHAASGLGFADPAKLGKLREIPEPAPVAYPDFVAGIAAFAAGFGLLGRADEGRRTGAGQHIEISMLDVIRPLVFGFFDADVGSNDPVWATR